MKATLVRSLLLALVFASAVVSAADVAGKWKAEFQAPDGSQMYNIFTFVVDGEKLTGTVYSSLSGADAKIEDGTIKGDELVFGVTRNIQGQDIKLRYKGKVSGDEIPITMNAGLGDQTFEIKMTAKREK